MFWRSVRLAYIGRLTARNLERGAIPREDRGEFSNAAVEKVRRDRGDKRPQASTFRGSYKCPEYFLSVLGGAYACSFLGRSLRGNWLRSEWFGMLHANIRGVSRKHLAPPSDWNCDIGRGLLSKHRTKTTEHLPVVEGPLHTG